MNSQQYPSFSTAVLILAAIAFAISVFVAASEMLMILFLAILFGILLTRVTGVVVSKTALPRSASLSIVVFLFAFLAVASTSVFFVQVNTRIEQTSDQLDAGVERVRQHVREYPALQSALQSVPLLGKMIDQKADQKANSEADQKADTEAGKPQGKAEQASRGDRKNSDSSQVDTMESLSAVPTPIQRVASALGQLMQTTFGLLVNSLLIFFVGLFLASAPETYRNGVLLLIPVRHRQRGGEVLDALGDTIWSWMLGRFGSMFVTGLGAFILLTAFSVPMAGTLGIATALLTFVPNIGAAVALLLAVLCALPEGMSVAAAVIIGYMILQLLESYLVTPLIQQQQVELPPAMLIAFQALMGVVFGFLGAAVASPLLAGMKKITEMLYIQDFLGDTESLRSVQKSD